MVAHARGFNAGRLPQLTGELAEDIAAEVVTTGRPVVLTDYPGNGRSVGRLDAVLADQNVHAVMSIPVMVDSQVFAVFNVFYAQPHDFSEAERRCLQHWRSVPAWRSTMLDCTKQQPERLR